MEENKNKKSTTILIWLFILVGIPILVVFIENQTAKQISPSYDNKSYVTTNKETPSSYNSTTTTTKKCQATPCPNNAESGSNYCSIHKKGKTKKCAKCGKAIWDDEKFCDSCLYGSVINSMSK